MRADVDLDIDTDKDADTKLICIGCIINYNKKGKLRALLFAHYGWP